MPAESKISMTPRDLSAALNNFISDNTHSRDEVLRWLASHLTPTLTLLGEVISQRGVGPELRKHVNEFRAKEIEAELEKNANEKARLERDLSKVRAA